MAKRTTHKAGAADVPSINNRLTPKKVADPAPKLRTPNEVAAATVARFSAMTAGGIDGFTDAWQKAISEEARIFAGEILRASAQVAGGKVGKAIIEQLAGVAG